MKKCHNCKGAGVVKVGEYSGVCYYCRGEGIRTSNYGQDKISKSISGGKQ